MWAIAQILKSTIYVILRMIYLRKFSKRAKIGHFLKRSNTLLITFLADAQGEQSWDGFFGPALVI